MAKTWQWKSEFAPGQIVTFRFMADHPGLGAPQPMQIVLVEIVYGTDSVGVSYYCRMFYDKQVRWGSAQGFSTGPITKGGYTLIAEEELVAFDPEAWAKEHSGKMEVLHER